MYSTVQSIVDSVQSNQIKLTTLRFSCYFLTIFHNISIDVSLNGDYYERGLE